VSLPAIEFPLRLTTGLNQREHWAVRAKRVRHERAQTDWALQSFGWQAREELRQHMERGGLSVEITRIGPRKVDTDGIVGGAKGVRDEVARWLGWDDGDCRWEWRYRAERGPYAVRIAFAPRFTDATGRLPFEAPVVVNEQDRKAGGK
jgi:hypothetical protein